MPLRTSQSICVVLYFILLENLPLLCNSILPPTYWGTLNKTDEDLTTEKVATELIFLLARSVSSVTPERYDLHNENGENMIRAITGTDRTADS